MNPLSHAVPGALVALLKAAPLSAGKVDFAWKTAVGSAIGRATAVRLEGGVLVIDVTSRQWAREIQRSSRVILARLQMLLGEGNVTALRVRTD